jgi:hypothetical protein
MRRLGQECGNIAAIELDALGIGSTRHGTKGRQEINAHRDGIGAQPGFYDAGLAGNA